MIRSRILVLMMILLLLPACGDDTTTPEGFRLTITVTDTSGDPLPGWDLALAPDTPYYQDGLAAAGGRPSVSIPFIVDLDCRVRIVIEDIEGATVRVLLDETTPSGWHHVIWDGHDEQGLRQSSGVYTARMAAYAPDDGHIFYENTRPMLLAILDLEGYSAGTTDDQGRMVITDKRLFPFLYNQPDIPAVDENADPIGVIQFTPTMRFILGDISSGRGMHIDQDVTGSANLTFTYDPAAAKVLPAESARPDTPVAPSGEKINLLGQPYPCPFN
jgi:hypothetical protein